MNKLFDKQRQSNPISAKMQEIFKLDLTTRTKSPYSDHALAKSKAERGNSNKRTANNSTPIYNRAFFVRSTSTSKENYSSSDLSMVACSGKGFALCCLPYVTVFHPVASYRQITVESEAIAPKNQHTELSEMIYLFLCVNRNSDTYQETIERIEADSEQNARFKLHADLRPILAHPIARINPNRTACTAQGGVYA
ncbi:hypothetical protein BMT54_08365 [Pasteurellaceae bacterium 15-036681]|nr:hypothetical protein BMT54_08365 [Pasteurellaceae bacterium 15-036681]